MKLFTYLITSILMIDHAFIHHMKFILISFVP